MNYNWTVTKRGPYQSKIMIFQTNKPVHNNAHGTHNNAIGTLGPCFSVSTSKSVLLYKTLITLCFSLAITGNLRAAVVDVADTNLTMNDELRLDISETLRYLQSRHYLANQLDDEYSAKTLNGYIKLLDPNKIYFTQKDIDNFQVYRHRLDDLLKRRDAEVAFDIFKTFRQRVGQRTKLILALINKDYDFTLDDSINIDTDSYQWAKDNPALAKIWEKRIKNDILQQMMAETPLQEIRENLTRRYQRQRDVIFLLKADEVFESFMNAYAKELGPHTQYMSHVTAENFRISLSLSLEGIGAALQTEQDYTVINRVIKGGPAELSGKLKPEDKIVGVAQEQGEMVNVIGWRLMDVVQLIRGDKGTKVRLQILKNGSVPGSPPETLELVRDIIQLEDQAAKLSAIDLLDDDQSKRYSVISIPSFYSNTNQALPGSRYTATTHDVRKLLKEVNASDSQGLIIDLRGNGGGYLNEAVSLTGLFIPEGPVVQVIQSNRNRKILRDTEPSVAYTGPLVVLIDRYSASASEIFAAALQDYGRAIIVGERSFGKGTVQRVVPLRYGAKVKHESQVKFTTAQFFRVNGGSTQHKGVTPDITLNSGVEDEEFGERAYDNALRWSQTRATIYQQGSIPSDLIEHLTKRHLARSYSSAAFTLLRDISARIADNKEIKELSLNIKERMKIRTQLEKQSLDQLNTYRRSLGLDAVTRETRSDHPLPNEDEHWNIVYHTEAAQILLDQSKWSGAIVTRQSAEETPALTN